MYDGLEIDMLALGNADSILLSRWNGNSVFRILIDAGQKGDFGTVRSFLSKRGISSLDAVVSTHPHDDHAGGILPLLEDQSIAIGSVYLHIPHYHLDMSKVAIAVKQAQGLDETVQVEKSLRTVEDIYKALQKRSIKPIEPFAGAQIDFATVVGPSKDYYQQLVKEFEDAEMIRTVSNNEQKWNMQNELIQKGEISESLEDNPETTPENDSSVILGCQLDSKKYLFTSDAGVPALQNAADAYDLKDLRIMQIPHHGSRHNINCALIKHFNPKQAWVSAKGSIKHPRRSVVNAFKNQGAAVYSTHYPTPLHLYLGQGNVPDRTGYSSAKALWD